MKKILLLILICLNSVFCFSKEIKFVITQDAYKYSDNDDDAEMELVKKGSYITIDPYSDCMYESWISGIDTVLVYDSIGFIPIFSLLPNDSKEGLPKELITHTAKTRIKNLIPDYYLEIIKNGDIKLLEKYEPYFKIDYTSTVGPFTAAGVTSNVSNCGIYFFSGNKIIFNSIVKKSDGIYECEGIESGDWDPYHTDLDGFRWSSILKNTAEETTEKFLLETDGDYFTVINTTQKKKILTMVFIDDSTMNELENLFRNNSRDLSKITWPRHADGSCDYKKGKTLVATSSSATNVSINKTMSVKENLKLRSAEATSSNVLTVMSAGTKVKIIELGKEETIDGINSNWVKVEVISGKDRDGNKLKSGMTGWCYGGYLE